MASKSTKHTAAGDDTVETAVKNGFEKATKGYEEFVAFAKDTAEAWTNAANVAGRGIETIQSALLAYSQQALEDGMSTAKALLETKNPTDFFTLQTDYARKSVDAYIAEVGKISDLAVSTTKNAAAPLQARVAAFVDLAQPARV